VKKLVIVHTQIDPQGVYMNSILCEQFLMNSPDLVENLRIDKRELA
jgi:hypothetical protein